VPEGVADTDMDFVCVGVGPGWMDSDAERSSVGDTVTERRDRDSVFWLTDTVAVAEIVRERLTAWLGVATSVAEGETRRDLDRDWEATTLPLADMVPVRVTVFQHCGW
jgi:hypothetical protein